MTPVAIGDTQGTLQARKTWFAVYERPETFLRLHMEVLPRWRFYKAWCQWQWDLTINHVYSAYFHYFPQWVIFGKTLAKWGWGSTPRCPGDPASQFQPLPAICWLAEKCHPWSQYPRKSWGLEKCQKCLQTYQGHEVILKNASKKFQLCIINS